MNISSSKVEVLPQASFSGDTTFYGQKVLVTGDLNVQKDITVDGNNVNFNNLSMRGKTLTFDVTDNIDFKSKTAFNARPEFNKGVALDRVFLKNSADLSLETDNGTKLLSLNKDGVRFHNDNGCFQGPHNSMCLNPGGAVVYGHMYATGDINYKGVGFTQCNLAGPDKKDLRFMALNADGLMFTTGKIIAGNEPKIIIGDWTIEADGPRLYFKTGDKTIVQMDASIKEGERIVRIHDGEDEGKSVTLSTRENKLVKNTANDDITGEIN
jgi:hypothetical protein